MYKLMALLFGIFGGAIVYTNLAGAQIKALRRSLANKGSSMFISSIYAGGALGGQLAATFIANNTAHGLPTVTGFTDTYVMATAFLIVCVLAALLIPKPSPEREPQRFDGRLEPVPEAG